MEPHDQHELALNRAFEERWQRRLERPRSVAALTALQYRERKKYELAWYKTETIQLTEQIEHLQNRLSFLMDQNTSLNLECQKLKKRVAQLENLCRDQLKNLVSRPSKSATGGSPSTSQTSGAAIIQNIINMDEDGEEPEDDEPADLPTKKPEQSKAERESEDAREKAAADALTSLGASGKRRHIPQASAPTATSTIRRGIRIVKQRSPSGKTTIVAAAASTAGPTSSSATGGVPVIISPMKNSTGGGHAAAMRSSVSPSQKHKILVPKRLISYTSGGGQSAGLRLVHPFKMKASAAEAMMDGRHYASRESRSSGGGSSRRYSHERRSLKERDFRAERSSSPAKTPPEVIISDEGSSDAEAREKRPRKERDPRPGLRFSDGKKILASSSAAAALPHEHRETSKRKHHAQPPPKSHKRSKSDNNAS